MRVQAPGSCQSMLERVCLKCDRWSDFVTNVKLRQCGWAGEEGGGGCSAAVRASTYFSFLAIFSWMGVLLREGERNKESLTGCVGTGAWMVSIDLELAVELVLADDEPSLLVMVVLSGSSKLADVIICHEELAAIGDCIEDYHGGKGRARIAMV